MKDGFVQQVDTPQNLYDYPTNQFVAGFIGSPQMNFFNVKLSKEGQDVVATFGDNKIVVPNSQGFQVHRRELHRQGSCHGHPS